MSIKSMTGFARKQHTCHTTPYFFEIQSVNKKHLEVHISPNKLWGAAEMDIRKALQKGAHRGQLLFRWYRDPTAALCIQPSSDNLRKIDQQLQELATELGYTKTWDMPFLLEHYRQASALSKESYDTLDIAWDAVLPPLLAAWDATRIAEGECIAKELQQCLERIEGHIRALDPYVQQQKVDSQNKLEGRILQLQELTEEDRIRIYKEVALYADKWDITEEVSRLLAHVQAFQEFLGSATFVQGRQLEFLSQELLREANTMASKSVHIEAIRRILSIKSECDKIREQVQNIE